jgi:hypothetical protein
MPALHGSDVVAAFCGKGRKTGKHVTSVTRLLLPSQTVDDNEMKILEKFVMTGQVYC